MTLWEIDKRIEDLMEQVVDPDTGEILDEEAKKALDGLYMDRDEKVENIALFIKNLSAEAEAVKNEKQKLAARQSAIENKVEHLKTYLTAALDGERFKTSRCVVSYRRSEQTVIEDIKAVPEEYLRIKEPEADKSKIKFALKLGKEVPGAHLEENVSIQIK